MRTSKKVLVATVAILGSFHLATAQPGSTNQAQEIKKVVKERYQGKMVTLRTFDRSTKIEYGPDGTLESRAKPGDWTLYGLLQITGVSVNNKRIHLDAVRIWAKYNLDKRQWDYLRSPYYTRIVFRLGKPGLNGQWDRAFPSAFLTAGESLADIVPPHWEPFLRGTAPDAKEMLEDSKEYYESDFSLRKRKSKRPRFSQEAQAAKVNGTAVIWVYIAADGRVELPMVLQPLGVGVEAEILKALKKWRYEVPKVANDWLPSSVLLEFKYRSR